VLEIADVAAAKDMAADQDLTAAKAALYAAIGVREYLVYDLEIARRGFRLLTRVCSSGGRAPATCYTGNRREGLHIAAERRPERITVDEWRALERTSDSKHEYRDGYLYAMAGGSQAHSRIAVNILIAVDAGLGDRPCIAYNSDAATRVSAGRFNLGLAPYG